MVDYRKHEHSDHVGDTQNDLVGAGRSVVDAVYNKYLPLCGTYCRAVGYFSVESLKVGAEPYATFFQNNGTMRLLYGTYIGGSLNDAGRLNSEAVLQIEQTLEQNLHLADLLRRYPAEAFYVLHSRGRIAVKRVESTKVQKLSEHDPIYHEKLGIFIGDSSRVAFIGSANETVSAITGRNFELTYVIKDHTAVCEIVERFNQMWEGEISGWRVVETHAIDSYTSETGASGRVNIDAIRLGWVGRDISDLRPDPTAEAVRLSLGVSVEKMQELLRT